MAEKGKKKEAVAGGERKGSPTKESGKGSKKKPSVPEVEQNPPKEDTAKPDVPFTNPIFNFSKGVQAALEVKVGEGAGATTLRKWLKDNPPKGALKIPDRKTIHKWLMHERPRIIEQKQSKSNFVNASKSLIDVEKKARHLLNSVTDRKGGIRYRKEMLEELAHFVILRLRILSDYQSNIMDSKTEQVINSHVQVINNLMQTVSKMESQYRLEGRVAARMMDKFQMAMGIVVRRVVERMFGSEKIKVILDAVRKETDIIDLHKIRDDSRLEVASEPKDDDLEDFDGNGTSVGSDTPRG